MDPEISVVMTTRDRAGRITGAVGSALDNDYPRFDLTIVDQSSDGRTESALGPWLGDPRVTYLRSPTRGLASGRNHGIGAARGELIAFTDDDCVVAADWLRELAGAFAVHDRIGVVFGNVLPVDHDSRTGFVPAYIRTRPAMARGLAEKGRVDGMGACMGVRRGTWEAVGGFDERLGAGARFRAGEEGDMTIRALGAGYFVYDTPAVTVTHNGFREWKHGRVLIHDYWYGSGAVLAKHLRRGEWSLLRAVPRLIHRWALGRSPVAASLGRRPHRALRLVAFVKGMLAGARSWNRSSR